MRCSVILAAVIYGFDGHRCLGDRKLSFGLAYRVVVCLECRSFGVGDGVGHFTFFYRCYTSGSCDVCDFAFYESVSAYCYFRLGQRCSVVDLASALGGERYLPCRNPQISYSRGDRIVISVERSLRSVGNGVGHSTFRNVSNASDSSRRGDLAFHKAISSDGNCRHGEGLAIIRLAALSGSQSNRSLLNDQRSFGGSGFVVRVSRSYLVICGSSICSARSSLAPCGSTISTVLDGRSCRYRRACGCSMSRAIVKSFKSDSAGSHSCRSDRQFNRITDHPGNGVVGVAVIARRFNKCCGIRSNIYSGNSRAAGIAELILIKCRTCACRSDRTGVALLLSVVNLFSAAAVNSYGQHSRIDSQRTRSRSHLII